MCVQVEIEIETFLDNAYPINVQSVIAWRRPHAWSGWIGLILILAGTGVQIVAAVKPGESSELITYTQDHTTGPEISCKVLRITPRGAATELDLLCNGEGELGVRQKELVQVIRSIYNRLHARCTKSSAGCFYST
jgi:hypothetical protein